MERYSLPRRLAAEALGTAFLAGAVVGSGIMADRLTGDEALALLGNTLPTGAILVVLITVFGPVSGAHFNPAVTMAFRLKGTISAGSAAAYVGAQIAGGLAGALLQQTQALSRHRPAWSLSSGRPSIGPGGQARPKFPRRDSARLRYHLAQLKTGPNRTISFFARAVGDALNPERTEMRGMQWLRNAFRASTRWPSMPARSPIRAPAPG